MRDVSAAQDNLEPEHCLRIVLR
eukprot:COSAG03_NODE_26954_length_256_cov_0.649682_1_plen_22_part_10